MLLVREIMYCKPGKVRPLVERFVKMNALGKRLGFPAMKVMTDLSAERFWMLVAEMEVPDLKTFEDMFVAGNMPGTDPQAMKEMEELMKGYHDFVDHGRREIYKLEG